MTTVEIKAEYPGGRRIVHLPGEIVTGNIAYYYVSTAKFEYRAKALDDVMNLWADYRFTERDMSEVENVGRVG